MGKTFQNHDSMPKTFSVPKTSELLNPVSNKLVDTKSKTKKKNKRHANVPKLPIKNPNKPTNFTILSVQSEKNL